MGLNKFLKQISTTLHSQFNYLVKQDNPFNGQITNRQKCVVFIMKDVFQTIKALEHIPVKK